MKLILIVFSCILLVSLVCEQLVEASRVLRWVGDVWLPPNGRMYTIKEIQHTFHKRRLLIIGDSLARRLTSTLALILNGDTSSDLLDNEVDNEVTLGVGHHDEKKWDVPSGQLVFKWAPHARDVESYLTKAMESFGYSDVIVAIGVHDAEKPTTSTEQDLQKALDSLRLLHELGVNILWRTTPLIDDPKHPDTTNEVNRRINRINSFVLKVLPPHIGIVDISSTLANKSLGMDRLKGNSAEHFSNIARVVQIQTITHELLKHETPS